MSVLLSTVDPAKRELFRAAFSREVRLTIISESFNHIGITKTALRVMIRAPHPQYTVTSVGDYLEGRTRLPEVFEDRIEAVYLNICQNAEVVKTALRQSSTIRRLIGANFQRDGFSRYGYCYSPFIGQQCQCWPDGARPDNKEEVLAVLAIGYNNFQRNGVAILPEGN